MAAALVGAALLETIDCEVIACVETINAVDRLLLYMTILSAAARMQIHHLQLCHSKPKARLDQHEIKAV